MVRTHLLDESHGANCESFDGAVVLTIRSIVNGFEEDLEVFGEAVAWVYWLDQIFLGDRIRGRMSGPFAIETAIRVASEVQSQWGFERVLIELTNGSVWRNEWDALLNRPG